MWNTRETNRKAIDDYLLHFFRTSSREGVEIDVQITLMSAAPLNLEIFRCETLPRDIQIKLRSFWLDLKTITTAFDTQEATSLNGFITALAVFVKKSRAELINKLVNKDP